jgi:hypothetical protein
MIGYGDVEWIRLAQNRVKWEALMCNNESVAKKCG